MFQSHMVICYDFWLLSCTWVSSSCHQKKTTGTTQECGPNTFLVSTFRTQFKNVWTNIHLTRPNAVDGNNNENNNSDDDACNDNDNNQDDNQPNKHWYDKAAPFIDQVNLASTKVCRFPSFSLSIDKMSFKGHSNQTF